MTGRKREELNMTDTPIPPHPWTIPVETDRISDSGEHRVITADAQVRAGIAQLGKLLDVPALKAELKLMPERGGQIRVTGRLYGSVVQSCVVTLEPVENKVSEDIDQLFAPASQIREMAALVDDAEEGDDETADPPEPIVDGVIDIGHLAVDSMFLGLDPYPRKPDAEFKPVFTPADPKDHPFAALKALKDS